MRRKSFLIVLVAVVTSFAAGNAVGYNIGQNLTLGTATDKPNVEKGKITF